MTGVPTYLDIGTVRIQTYLGRSRHLWGRRGASALLAETTRREQVEEAAADAARAVGAAVERADDAPDIDGVVSLILANKDDATRVAHLIAARLSRALPGLHLVAQAATAPTYVGARLAMRDQPRPLFEWLPPQHEYPPTVRCAECGQDAAAGEVTVGGKDTLALCPDCTARRPAPTRRPFVRRGAERRARSTDADQFTDVGQFTVEAKLLTAFDADAVDDFAGLARLSTGRRVNHIATIAADGNSLGALFKAAGTSGDSDLVCQLSRDVKAAMWEALVAATRAVYRPDPGSARGFYDERLPVIPHLLGGDDLLVSVPADRAWRFARCLLKAFGAPESPIAKVARQLEVRPPTLSAGLVIAHQAQPFGQQVSLAERLLREAKAAVAGQGFSVAWLDVTSDGLSPVSGRTTWTLDRLETCDAALVALTKTPLAARQALLRELDHDDVTLARQRVQSRLRRQEDTVANAVERYLGVAGTDLLTGPDRATECVRALREGISLARWWA